MGDTGKRSEDETEKELHKEHHSRASEPETRAAEQDEWGELIGRACPEQQEEEMKFANSDQLRNNLTSGE